MTEKVRTRSVFTFHMHLSQRQQLTTFPACAREKTLTVSLLGVKNMNKVELMKIIPRSKMLGKQQKKEKGRFLLNISFLSM